MTFDYARIAANAQRMLAKYGRAESIRHKTSGEYDPDLGRAPVAEVVQDCVAVVFDVEQKLIDGTNVLAGDKTAYVGAVGVTLPLPGHVLTWVGKQYSVVRAKDLAPGGVSVLYELLVRP